MDRIERATVALWAVVALAMGALSWGPVRRAHGAVHLLVDLAQPVASAPGALPNARIRTLEVSVPDEGAGTRARLYLPPDTVHRCVVVGHGVHHLGIDEPRLGRFARALAAVGVEVLTPELTDLADYRITRAGATALGDATRYLAGRCPRRNGIGLLGFSFAGGLALLAAADPRTRVDLSYVTSVGGYDDLERVLQFLVSGTVTSPPGERRESSPGAVPLKRAPHEYGLVVLLYEYLEHFVPKVDLPVATRAVRAWLEEDRERAWAEASRRTTLETEQLFVRLATGRIQELAPEMKVLLEAHTLEMEALSPRGHLRAIPVPIYLLHGSGDSVIPPEETEWADQELGSQPHAALVTSLIEHVEMTGTPRLRDELSLVTFMARLL